MTMEEIKEELGDEIRAWKRWKLIIERDWHYLVIIIILLGFIYYLTWELGDNHRYCMQMVESLGCFNPRFDNILGGI